MYVSFGTVLGHMDIAAETYRVALAAAARIDARVLLTIGHRFDPSLLGEPPRNVHVEPWVDQVDVLAQADVVVCHGGSGTTFGALAAGVPLVIVPLFADQFTNGTLVDRAGAGMVVDRDRDTDGRPRRLGEEDAAGLADVIDAVRCGASFRRNAERIADEMARAPTVDHLLDELVAAGR